VEACRFDREWRRVNTYDVTTALLKMERSPSSAAPDIGDAALDVSKGRLFGARPFIKVHEVDLGPSADLNDAVITLNNFGFRSTLDPIE
jgi:hypothetical protein